jgi:hypothetical protein
MSERAKHRKGLSSLFRRKKASSTRSDEGSLPEQSGKGNALEVEEQERKMKPRRMTTTTTTTQDNIHRKRTIESTKRSESMGTGIPTSTAQKPPPISIPSPSNGNTNPNVLTPTLQQQSKRFVSISNLRTSPPPLPTVPRQVSIIPAKPESTSWFSQTEYFQRMSNWAFDMVDTDGSGCVDEKVCFSHDLHVYDRTILC